MSGALRPGCSLVFLVASVCGCAVGLGVDVCVSDSFFLLTRLTPSVNR